MIRPLFALLVLGCASCASAEDPAVDKARSKIAAALPEIDQANIHPSEIPGLYEVHKGSMYGYVTDDGRLLIQGDMVNLETGEEITERRRSATRVEALNQFGAGQVIQYGPEKPKYVVTVFTDIDCGYCRKLHAEMSTYNSHGIAVRYLFFPRSGPNTPSFAKAEQVWCAADRREALTQAKQGLELRGGSCPNPVLAQYQLGESLGVNATPMIFLPDGTSVRGYVPAPALAARLNAAPAAKTRALN